MGLIPLWEWAHQASNVPANYGKSFAAVAGGAGSVRSDLSQLCVKTVLQADPRSLGIPSGATTTAAADPHFPFAVYRSPQRQLALAVAGWAFERDREQIEMTLRRYRF